MSNMYSVARKNKKVSKNALLSLCVGLVCLTGYALLIIASIISIGNVGVVGGFLGCFFLLAAVFGALWGALCYDEARTLNKFKKAGIVVNIIAIAMGLLLLVI